MPGEAWPSERVPPEMVAAVRAQIAPVIDGVLAAIRAENPVYSAVLQGPEGVAIRLGVEQAMKAFLDAVQSGVHPSGEAAELWRRLGEAEFQAGRSLEALRAAFRTGIRAAWRGAAELAVRAGLPPELVIALAEAIFVYSDELATDVVEGYVRMQSDQAGERSRRRRRLLALLVEEHDHDPEAIAHAAQLADWRVPGQVAAVALGAEEPGRVARRLDAEILVGSARDRAVLLVPDPAAPGRDAMLATALDGMPAVLGPATPPAQASRSLGWARLGLSMIESGTLPPASPLCVDDHLPALIVMQDCALAERLVKRRLAPLDALPEPERERLAETLQAWLDHQRHTPGVAAELHVHPQTVRYRMGKLRELLGDAIDDVDGRFELELALRARRALASPGPAAR